MTREISAGGVVLRRMRGRWWLAAIQPQRGEEKVAKARRRGAQVGAQRPVLALPKGWVEEGEKPEISAAREVEEETGLKAEMVRKLGDIKYVYVRKWSGGERVFKIVSFYLFRYRSGVLGQISPEMSREVRSACWLALDEAVTRLTYGGERLMASAARDFVRNNPGF